MAMNCFADVTGTVRIPILEGQHWIEFRSELSVGDEIDQQWEGMTVEERKSGAVKILPQKRVGPITDLAQAIVGWSLWDADGPVPLKLTVAERAEQIRGLKREIGASIREAYKDYYDRQLEKKDDSIESMIEQS